MVLTSLIQSQNIVPKINIFLIYVVQVVLSLRFCILRINRYAHYKANMPGKVNLNIRRILSLYDSFTTGTCTLVIVTPDDEVVRFGAEIFR